MAKEKEPSRNGRQVGKLDRASIDDRDLYWMGKALKLAEAAARRGEVPVGALIVGPDDQGNEVLISRASNQRETLRSALGHAELLAIHRASKKRKAWRLTDCTLYVTLEPCVMCAGAIVQARLSRVVYGASDPKGGAVESLYEILQDSRLNHRCEVTGGMNAPECGQILSNFFRRRRGQL